MSQVARESLEKVRLNRNISLQPGVGKTMVRRVLISGDKEGDEGMDITGKALKASPGQCQ